MKKLGLIVLILSFVLTAMPVFAAQEGKAPEKSLFQIISDTITPIGETNVRTEPQKVVVFQNMSNAINKWDEGAARAKELSLRSNKANVK